MKMDKVASSGNDEFYTPPYAIEPILPFIPEGMTVWCPFDTDESHIPRMIREKGNVTIATHLNDGFDFFSTPCLAEMIISNPPYSMKNEVFERLFAIGKPFAMLVGIVGLFESQRRFKMFRENKFEMLYLNKRVSYFKSYEDQKPALNPPFSSAWVCSGVLPQPNMFAEIHK